MDYWEREEKKRKKRERKDRERLDAMLLELEDEENAAALCLLSVHEEARAIIVIYDPQGIIEDNDKLEKLAKKLDRVKWLGIRAAMDLCVAGPVDWLTVTEDIKSRIERLAARPTKEEQAWALVAPGLWCIAYYQHKGSPVLQVGIRSAMKLVDLSLALWQLVNALGRPFHLVIDGQNIEIKVDDMPTGISAKIP